MTRSVLVKLLSRLVGASSAFSLLMFRICTSVTVGLDAPVAELVKLDLAEYDIFQNYGFA